MFLQRFFFLLAFASHCQGVLAKAPNEVHKFLDAKSDGRAMPLESKDTIFAAGGHDSHRRGVPRLPPDRASRKLQGELFLQRSSMRSLRSFKAFFDPQNVPQEVQDVEDMETILGVPKIVWVILADVMALAAFLSCVPLLMYVSRKDDED